MKVIVCRPGEDARVEDIAPGLDPLNAIVGGCVNTVKLAPGICAYVHDEGIVLGLPWNRQVGPQTYLAGPIVVTGTDRAGEDRDLTTREQVDVLRLLNVIAPRMTGPSSMADLEKRTGEKALRFYSGDFGAMVEKCAGCGKTLDPERKGFCPACHTPPAEVSP